MFCNSPLLVRRHTYLLAATGVKNFHESEFNSRLDAEIAMHEICSKLGIAVDCTEFDKHERKYSNHEGVRFYINRI